MEFKYLGVCQNCNGEVIYKRHCENYVSFDCNGNLSGTRNGKPYVEKCNTRHLVPIKNNGGQIQQIN